MMLVKTRFTLRLARQFPNATITTIPGKKSQMAIGIREDLLDGFDTLLDEVVVEMLSVTSTAELLGVTGVDGLKLHCAPGGNPAPHDRVTALVKVVPTGCTVRAYAPVVCPAVTVWLQGAAQMTENSCARVKETVAEWLGAPVVSCVLIIMLYAPGAALVGISMVAVRLAVPPLAREIGLAGVSTQMVPGSADALQVALMLPV
jgi:hypothetical protein